ncbi:MAG: DUF5063 domain-containing protein [Bacteroidales bacterium]|nr:DUF5063 domain-containing protein [Bacteroidales bacterium]
MAHTDTDSASSSSSSSSSSLAPNALAFMALCNEYCVALEHARESSSTELVDTMLRLLPRLYMTATDLKLVGLNDEAYIDSSLEEDFYEAIRCGVESVLGPDDTYLEVFEEDMKYSDTPIAASISEGLADIFQVLYNFLEMVKDAPDAIMEMALQAVKEDFESYWSRVLCNVLRALNHLRYSGGLDSDFDE